MQGKVLCKPLNNVAGEEREPGEDKERRRKNNRDKKEEVHEER